MTFKSDQDTIDDLEAKVERLTNLAYCAIHLHDWFDVNEYRATDPNAAKSRRDLQNAIDACTEAGDFKDSEPNDQP